MPYRTNSDLPASVQAHLPPHAQDVYREAFNHAFSAHVGELRQEEAAPGRSIRRELTMR
ncbi:MAG TPA: ChaB family protein [Xanthobacteraceae bacterium]|jgi:cation transport regulator